MLEVPKDYDNIETALKNASNGDTLRLESSGSPFTGRRKCGRCGKKYRPYKKGKDGFPIIERCPRCGSTLIDVSSEGNKK